MKYFALLLLASLLTTSAVLSGQASIHDRYGLRVGGCPIDTGVVAVTAPPSYPAPPPPPPPPPPGQEQKQEMVTFDLEAFRAKFRPFFADDYVFPAGRKVDWHERKLDHSLLSFRQGGYLGIRDTLGTVVLPAVYHHVETTSRPDVFIGYGARYANLYDRNGKPLLGDNVVFIKPLTTDRYVVQKITGYGVYDGVSGKMILPATNRYVGFADGNAAKESGILRVVRDAQTAYMLLPGDVRLSLPAISVRPSYRTDGFLSYRHEKKSYLIDLSTLRDVSCGGKIDYASIGGTSDLYRVRLKGQRYGFLAKRDGKLLRPDTIMNARRIKGTDQMIVTVYAGGDYEKMPRHWPQQLHGIMTTSGETILPPTKYNKLNEIKYPYFMASEPGRRTGMIDVRDGREIIPFNYSEKYMLRGGKEICFTHRYDGRAIVDLYTFPEGKKRWGDKGGHMLVKETFNGQPVYRSTGDGDDMLLSYDGERLLDRRYTSVTITGGGKVISAYDGDTTILLGPDLQPIVAQAAPPAAKDQRKKKRKKDKLRKPAPSETQVLIYAKETSLTKDLHLRSLDGRVYFLDRPDGRRDTLAIALSSGKSLGYRDFFRLTNRDHFAIVNSQGDFLVDPVAGRIGDRFYPSTGELWLNVKDMMGDRLTLDGRLLFGGEVESTNGERLDLIRLYVGNDQGFGNWRGGIVLPPAGGRLQLNGGLIVRDGVRFYRDGEMVK